VSLSPSGRAELRPRLQTLAAARMIRAGGLVAHATATVPGVAASPWQPAGVKQLLRFKQRPGPFLILADAPRTAMRLAPFFTPGLRRLMHESWPGRTTLVFRARPGLPACCYQGGRLAVRVDASPFVRQLARRCGGLVLSSSLNRRGQATQALDRHWRWRWHRHLAALLPGEAGEGTPSAIWRVRGRRTERLR
jgi:L-threonylcarbamoyladenylate synthase